ncbi:MAG: hypothetical protein AAF206_26870, partial [Bacteroidota bacterium]
VKHDAGTHFSGMNHPYGEHVLYTDNQPVLSWIMRWVDRHIVSVADQTTGIINSLILWSLVLSMLLLHRIGKHFHLPHWYAIPVAILLSLLTPQMHRFAGHYALAYSVFIPLTWWLLILATEKRRHWLWLGILAAELTFFGFIHPYYILMGVIFCGAYLVLGTVNHWKKNRPEAYRYLIRMAVAMLVPLLLFQGFMAMTDPVSDRPSAPSGFFFFRAYLDSVFLPVQGPLWNAWHRFMLWKRPPVEGFSYIGLTASLVAVLSIARMLSFAIRKRWSRVMHPALPANLRRSTWAGVLVLLFSMAIPFQWNLEFLLDLMTPLKQFRSLGRFAWVFYYTFTMYAAVYLFLLYKRAKQKGLRAIGLGVLCIGLGFWLWETAIHLKLHADVARKTRGDNIFINQEPDLGAWLAESGHEVSEFQTLMPLPFFNIGTDKFVPQYPQGPTMARAYKMAFEHGIPLACGSMSRTSLGQASRIMQLLSGPLVEKPILDDYNDLRPILILRQYKVPLSWNEQRLLAKADLLVEKGNFALLSLPIQQLKPNVQALNTRFLNQKDSVLVQDGPVYKSDASAFVYWDGFDGEAMSDFGDQTISAVTDEVLMLFDQKIPDTTQLLATAWMRIDPAHAGFPVLYYKEFDAEGQQVDYQEIATMFGQYVYQDWIQVRHQFQLKGANNRVQLYLKNKAPEAESLLIRPEGVEVFLPIGESLMINNFYLEP